MPPDRDVDPPPPLLGSWRNVYAVVLGTQTVVVAILYALTRLLT